MWRDIDARRAGSSRVGGTGSISCLGLTKEEADDAQERRGPIGFTYEAAKGCTIENVTFQNYVSDAVSEAMIARAKKVERLLRDVGECLWTARDLVVVHEQGDTFWVTP